MNLEDAVQASGRLLVAVAASSLLALLGGSDARAEPKHGLSFFDARAEPKHGLSFFGELEYAPDFPHFGYVNPDAPKGGTLRMPSMGTFFNLNPFIRQVHRSALGSRWVHRPGH